MLCTVQVYRTKHLFHLAQSNPETFLTITILASEFEVVCPANRESEMFNKLKII